MSLNRSLLVGGGSGEKGLEVVCEKQLLQRVPPPPTKLIPACFLVGLQWLVHSPQAEQRSWAESSKTQESLLLLGPLEIWNHLPDLIILSPGLGIAEQDRDPRRRTWLELSGLVAEKTAAATAWVAGVWVVICA